jgi:acetyltransferase-like isoleucine patch superfamily enzyme
VYLQNSNNCFFSDYVSSYHVFQLNLSILQAGVVIGETAVVEDDVIILQGVTLGGTGKERGDRHPKVRRRAILEQSCSVLGNITVGEGAIICAKSIVTKPVPSFTKASGVPAVLSGEVNWFASDEAMGNLQNDDVSSDFKDALTKMSHTFWANIESELANASMSS